MCVFTVYYIFISSHTTKHASSTKGPFGYS